VEEGKICRAEDYIKGLNETDRKRLIALLEHTAEHGPPTNREKFQKLDGDIFEFKSYQDRILCFFQPRKVLVLTHGFRKKKDRAPKEEIERAERLRKEYLGD